MITTMEKPIIDFFRYPPLGAEDWRYVFATARVRVLESQMLTRANLQDMINSANFAEALEALSSTEYALPQGDRNFTEVEKILKERRSQTRELFGKLIIDKAFVALIREREDFANIRLALRRKLTEKPIGVDYSNEGSIDAEQFEEIFEQENYSPLPLHMQQAIEQGVLSYYQNKDIRQIDYAVDSFQIKHEIRKAAELGSEFLVGLFRIQADLINIRTMLRLKFTNSEQRDVFIDGGYVERAVLKHGLDIGYEAMGQLFFATPYHKIVEIGTAYLAANSSFLKLEQQCDEYLIGFLKSAFQITAGYQPIVAYLLMKENEIRTVRLILTAKKNGLDNKVVTDRLIE